jgi:hypothetical protein
MKKHAKGNVLEDAFGREEGGKTPRADHEVMGDIVEQAKQVQRVAEKIYFLSILKRFGLAFGGILLLLGTLSTTAFFLLFFGIFSTGLPGNIELLAEIGLALISIIHILAGLALLAG